MEPELTQSCHANGMVDKKGKHDALGGVVRPVGARHCRLFGLDGPGHNRYPSCLSHMLYHGHPYSLFPCRTSTQLRHPLICAPLSFS